MTTCNEDVAITYESSRRNEKIRFSEAYLEQICVAATPRESQDWHRVVDSYVRNHYVLKLVRTMHRDVATRPVTRYRMQELLDYAVNLERDAYRSSDTRSLYYGRMASIVKRMRYRQVILQNNYNNNNNDDIDNLQTLAMAASYVERIDTPESSSSSSSSESSDDNAQQRIKKRRRATDFRTRWAKSIQSTAEASDNGAEYGSRMCEGMRNGGERVVKNDTQDTQVSTTTEDENDNWRDAITLQYRGLLVFELFELTHQMENADDAAKDARRTSTSMEDVRNVEIDLFNRARSKSDYFRMMADEKRRLNRIISNRRSKDEAVADAPTANDVEL